MRFVRASVLRFSSWLRGDLDLSGLLSKGIITQAFLHGGMNEHQIPTTLANLCILLYRSGCDVI